MDNFERAVSFVVATIIILIVIALLVLILVGTSVLTVELWSILADSVRGMMCLG